LENLLEWSRSQTGNIDFTPDVFDLSGMLEENRLLLSTQANAKKISLQNVGTSALVVSAHKQSINTVIRNLISNAIKFTPEGGRITTRVVPAEHEVIVAIEDTGVGMEKTVIEKLFRIDTKLTTKGTADEKGTGLGLILCKDFVEKNSGKIWVESEPGKGTTFSFSLPYNPNLVVAKPVEMADTVSS
jgi:signal transduction histidine kinase